MAAAGDGVVSLHGGYLQKCRYFIGIQHETCDAGVRLDTVRDASQSGPSRWPCLTLIGRPEATTTCALRVLMTPEEHDAEEMRLVEAFAVTDAAIAAGNCPVCGQRVEPTKIVGRCTYAACGHRLGQTSAEEP